VTVRGVVGLVVPLLVALGACGSDDAGDDARPTPPAPVEDAPDDAVDDAAGDTADDPGAVDPDEGSDDAAAPVGGAGGTATLTLANGETFEFAGLLCALEPQMAAGSEILFNAVSYQDPGLDVTQFGDEGTITGVASISVYDADYDTLWEANSMFGSSVELTLDGNTIRGTGAFLPGGELTGEPVDGELVADC